MKILIADIHSNTVTTIEADTESLLELELRYKFEDVLQKVPVGDLSKCLDKINLMSYFHAKRSD